MFRKTNPTKFRAGSWAGAQLLFLVAATAGAMRLAAQTQVDLRTQSKGVNFEAAPYTRPLRTVTALPSTCTPNELLLLTSAPAGSNIYACLAANTWVPEGGSSGTLTIQSSGVSVGVRATENFIAGSGLVNIITDTGNKLNIQENLDTAVVLTNDGLQSGQALLCPSASGSATSYGCFINPTLRAYTPGMVLHWKPDVTAAGGPITLNVDLLGAAPVLEADGVTNPSSTDIVAGQLATIWYDGSVFRLIATGGNSSGGVSGPPSAITSTTAGGATTVVAASEWHAPLAVCPGASTAALVWNTPPASSLGVTAGGCAGANVNDAWAAFGNAGTPSVQTSLTLPQTLTGKADVYVRYLTSSGGGAFTIALDAACVPANGGTTSDPAFVSNNFFAPGQIIAPLTANTFGTVSVSGLTWPAACTAGSIAYLRLIRTDTGGTVSSVGISELTIVLRRTL